MSNINDDDIFHMIRYGNPACVRLWLDNVENDFNICDDHLFSLLHWTCWDGKLNLVDLLIQRGAKLNLLNNCDDTPLHCAVKNGHIDVVRYLIKYKIKINSMNLHGNTPLHYACYHSYLDIALELINAGALVNLCNRYSQIPLDLCKKNEFLEKIINQAKMMQQNLTIRIAYQESAQQQQQQQNNYQYEQQNSFNYIRSRSIDSTINGSLASLSTINSLMSSIDINELETKNILQSNQTHQTWLGIWQSMDVIIKVFNKKTNINRSNSIQLFNQSQARVINNFQNEYKKLRIFNCNNILPVLGVCLNWPSFIIITQYIPNGSLYDILHVNQVSLVIKTKIQIAIDIAKGMNFLHQLDATISPFIYLNSKHVVLDNDYQAKINMSNFVFETLNPLNKFKFYSPAWQSPESLIKPLNEINKEAANMWSFAICLWELYTSKIPFEELTSMQCGHAIVKDNLRIQSPVDMSPHWQKLIRICMNEDPSKRPKFDMIIPILEKLNKN